MISYFTLSDSLDVNEFYNSLDHNPETWETEWGNPYITKDYISDIKSLGFGGICLPVTFFPHIKWEINENGDNESLVCTKTDEWFFNRIKEIVSYILDEKMKCIIRIQHDTDWLRDNGRINIKTLTLMKYKALVDLFINEFSDLSNDVYFEAFNEFGFEIIEYDDPLSVIYADNDVEELNLKKKLFFQCLDYFIKSIRKVNVDRKLLIPGVYHDTGYTAKYMSLFESIMDENCILAIHWYEPSVYTLTTNRDSISEVESTTISYLNDFNKESIDLLKTLCIKFNVIISEYGCTMKNHSDDEIYDWFAWCKSLFDELQIDRAIWMEKPGKSVIDRESLQESISDILDVLL